MSERKLASIQRIAEIRQIENAENIEAVRVNGWWVVAKKGEFAIGELAVYFEIDSWMPTNLAPFLSKGEPREYNGVKGERLRTIKLRGQLSQGLVLPISIFPPTATTFMGEGADATEILGIQKWEKPVPAQLAGLARGNFPAFIPRTDQERVQNISEIFFDTESEYEVTIKLDGSSMTCYWQNGNLGVCSRNIDLKLDQSGNTFVDTAKRIFADRDFDGLAIQGELMGPGIQGNREGFEKHEFFVFDIWEIRGARYFTPTERVIFCAENWLTHVPVIGGKKLAGLDLNSVLALADGESINNPIREGIVFKRADGKASFKSISNKFLLAEK